MGSGGDAPREASYVACFSNREQECVANGRDQRGRLDKGQSMVMVTEPGKIAGCRQRPFKRKLYTGEVAIGYQ